MKILDYLSGHHIDFVVRHHSECYTAQREAAAQHVSGHIFAKTVVVHVNGGFVMLVLPASHRVDLVRVRQMLGAEARLATERELANLFTDCDLGAEPPFGSQYGLPTLVDEALAEQDSIAVRAGNHHEVVLLQYDDYQRLEAPEVAEFCSAAR